MEKPAIRSYKDLIVYKESYELMLIVHTEIISKIPNHERYDLVSQLSRSSKAVPRLIAEGYAKKHQKAGFQKYLDDTMAETNETIVSLEQAKDIYSILPERISELLKRYDIVARQTYNLRLAWQTFKQPKP